MISVKDISLKLDDFLRNIIKDTRGYFLSGSFQFETQRKESDVDVCIPIQFKQKVMEAIVKSGFAPVDSNYNAGVKFVTKDFIVNLIFLHPVEYVCWYKTAKMIVSCDLFKIYETKIERQKAHAIHQMLLAAVKLTLPIIITHNMFSFIDEVDNNII